LLPTLTTVLERFPKVRRLILVADRGLLSLDNLEALQAIRLANGQALEFIIAVPGRRYHEFSALLGDFHRQRCATATEEVTGEVAWNGLRLVVAHDPAAAANLTQRRNERIDELIAQGEQWAGKLVDQDGGVKHRGRKLSDSGTKARFYHAVCEAHLSKIIKIDMPAELFSYDIDVAARTLAEMMDGKLLLVTNTPDIEPAGIVARYKSLADIERGFKVLKSEIEIGPVYHRLPERIRAHASLCFMALILHRIMRSRLRAAGTGLTPERALEQLHRIQHHRVRLNGAAPMAGVSTISTAQSEVLNALRIRKPKTPEQLTLL
jgi:transposase